MARKTQNEVVSTETSTAMIAPVMTTEQIKAQVIAEMEAEKAQAEKEKADKQSEQAKNHRERLTQAVTCFTRKCLSAGKTLGEYANAISSGNIPHILDIASMNGASDIKLACLFESASKFITDLVNEAGTEVVNDFAKARKVKIVDKSPRAQAYQILVNLQKLVISTEKSKNEIANWHFQ